ncbi:Tannase and feruloyl esterase [Arthrobotrys musiformis]|uniref:Carboxylic ester hydrolase n=1 Tax=Arthrobotrys musiformis TaxID=47236 RepID=A0AAV9W510_9PEZI
MKSYYILALSCAAAEALADFRSECAALSTSFIHENTDVLISEYVPAGTNLTFPELAATTCDEFVVTLADMCRLKLNHSTSSTSRVIMEVFLPTDWKLNGRRFLMTGNSGLGGCISYSDLVFGAKLGFATVGHDNGHTGATGLPFLNRPEVIKDFAWRALYEAGRVGRAAVNFFYTGGNIRKSYYMGCSTGGRQGMKAAQDFPEEYDGIISAAPAIRSAGLSAITTKTHLIFGKPGSPSHLTLEQWARVHRMVAEQCDWIDGVLDGVLEDPMKCQPRPEALLCKSGQSWGSHQCLSLPQVKAIREFYQPMYGNGGKFLFPRMQPLTHEFLGFLINYGGTPSKFPEHWYRYALFSNPDWSISSDFNLDVVDKDLEDQYGLETYNTDLSYQKGNRTKVLLYHGLTDGLISSENSYEYYNDVSRTMGLTSKEMDEFFRFFPIPGLDHCFTGNGAWYVGGPVQFETPGFLALDPSDSALMSMVKWVEDGVAPDILKGRKIVDGVVVSEKNHCKYPKQNIYKGSGDPNLASNWKCNSELV